MVALTDGSDEQAVRDFFRERLSEGNTLSQRLTQLPLESGYFSSMPANTTKIHLEALRSGGALRPKDSLADLAIFIKKYLDESVLNCAVFEDPYLQHDFLVQKHIEHLFWDNEVYYLLQGELSLNDIATRITQATSAWRFFCILTRDTQMDKVDGRQAMTEPMLSRFMDQIVHIAIDAYDGEGYLVYSMAQ